MFEKKLMLIRQKHQKIVTFVIVFFFLDKDFKYKPHLCNGCYDLMQIAINFNHVAIVSVKGSNFRIHFWYMSKMMSKYNEKF